MSINSNFFILPVEIREKILEKAIFSNSSKSLDCFLACIRTCKDWYQICEGAQIAPLSKTRVSISPQAGGIFSKLSYPLLERFQAKLNGIDKRQKLILENPETSSAVREAQIHQLLELPQGYQREFIQELDVSKVDFSMAELLHLVRHLPNLRKLKINAKRLWRKEELNSQQFNELLKQCPNLASLTLKYSSLSSEVFESLKQCSQLQEIDLRYSKEIDGRIFIHLAQLSSLKKINLAYCSNVDDEELSHINQISSAWEELNVSNCQGEFSQKTLEKISGLSPNFTLLKEEEKW